jgi:hypothetical protein
VPAATPLTSLLRDPRGSLGRTARRHRRPLAAALAGLAAVLALTTLRSSPHPAPSAADRDPTNVAAAQPGEVTVPVVLASGAIAAVLEIGDVIDLVGPPASEGSGASVVARDARVVELPLSGSALGGTSVAVVLVALPESDALNVITSMADGLTPVIRSR